MIGINWLINKKIQKQIIIIIDCIDQFQFVPAQIITKLKFLFI